MPGPEASATAPRASREPSRRLIAVLAVVTVVVLLVSALVLYLAHGDRVDATRARPGEVLSSYYVEAESMPDNTVDLALPYGHVKLAVEAPTDHVRVDDDEDQGLRPPDGGRFVGLWVQLDQTRQLPYLSATSHAPDPATVVLHADGESYPLDEVGRDLAATGEPQSFTVATAGPGEDLSLSVTFDGVTQSVDLSSGEVDPGAAASLYEENTFDGTDFSRAMPLEGQGGRCGPARISDGVVEAYPSSHFLRCRVGHVVTTPYLAGTGWARSGSTFLATTVAEKSMAEATIHGRDYQAENPSLSFRLGHRSPAAVVKVNALGGPLSIQDVDDPWLVVFEVPEGSTRSRLTVRQDYVGTSGFPTDGPTAPRFRVVWRTPLGQSSDEVQR